MQLALVLNSENLHIRESRGNLEWSFPWERVRLRVSRRTSSSCHWRVLFLATPVIERVARVATAARSASLGGWAESATWNFQGRMIYGAGLDLATSRLSTCSRGIHFNLSHTVSRESTRKMCIPALSNWPARTLPRRTSKKYDTLRAA